jgi:hypothetical protein
VHRKSFTSISSCAKIKDAPLEFVIVGGWNFKENGRGIDRPKMTWIA